MFITGPDLVKTVTGEEVTLRGARRGDRPRLQVGCRRLRRRRQRGFVDDVIEPAETRRKIVAGLRVLRTKQAPTAQARQRSALIGASTQQSAAAADKDSRTEETPASATPLSHATRRRHESETVGTRARTEDLDT